MIKNNSDNIKKVAIIILNYNSWGDTIECLEYLKKIDYSDYLTIVVDNASSDGSIEKIRLWADQGGVKTVEYQKEIAEEGGIKEQEDEFQNYPKEKRLVLIRNNANSGYSAGNNIGIRYAIKKNADAVLIMNPDVRIEDPATLQKLVDVMFSDDLIYIVGPNIIDANGNRQSPLREPSFFEECINPFLSAIQKRVNKKPIDYLLPIKSNRPFEVEKVSGSCLLIRTSFLKKIDLLDENVFLYCEEPILASQTRQERGKILFDPNVSVHHFHKKPSAHSLRIFYKSRLYYLKRYSRYNRLQLSMLTILYKVHNILARVKNNWQV